MTFTLCVKGYYGIAQWLPSFFARSYGLSSASIGLELGFAFGVGSILGATGGAFLAPLLIRRDRRWEMRLPAAAFLLCAPTFMISLQMNSAWGTMTGISLASVIMGIGFAPAYAALQSVAEARVRATAFAMMMFVSALVGKGAGPMIVGALSDRLSPSFGAESLRVALSFYTIVLVGAGASAWFTSRSMLKDLVN